MIYLFKKINDTKYYFNKERNDFIERAKATEFKTPAEIYIVVKGFNIPYDSLNDLGMEWASYSIAIKEYELSITYSSKEEAIENCNRLNSCISEPIFFIKENIFLETPATNLFPEELL